jgi:Molecular chaperone (small heat shock protein)
MSRVQPGTRKIGRDQARPHFAAEIRCRRLAADAPIRRWRPHAARHGGRRTCRRKPRWTTTLSGRRTASRCLAATCSRTNGAWWCDWKCRAWEKDEFDIEVLDDARGERGEALPARAHEGRYRMFQGAYGGFRRVVPLPVPVLADGCKASYKAGVLKIELTEAKPAKPMSR